MAELGQEIPKEMELEVVRPLMNVLLLSKLQRTPEVLAGTSTYSCLTGHTSAHSIAWKGQLRPRFFPPVALHPSGTSNLSSPSLLHPAFSVAPPLFG